MFQESVCSRGCPKCFAITSHANYKYEQKDEDKEGKQQKQQQSVEHVKLGQLRQFVDWLRNLMSSANEETT